MCRRGPTFPYGFLQQENNGDAAEADQRHVAKIVYIGPETGLSGEREIDQCVGLLQGSGGGGSAGGQKLLSSLQRLVDRNASRTERRYQFAAMSLLVPGDNCVDHGDSDTPANVAQQ